MKPRIGIILLVILPNILLGQNYLDYYQGINNGRVLAGNNQVEKSIASYYSTFEKFDFVYARDCYNAIELSAFSMDTSKLDYFIKRGIKQGLEWNSILKIKNMSKFKNSTFLNKIFKEKDSLENLYSKSINWEIRNEIIEMFKEDQKMREKCYNALLIKRIKISRDWEKLNKKQVERLIEITQKHGFPGEKLIGIDKNEMHPKIISNNSSAGMPVVIFIHHYSKPNKSYSSLLLEQIKLGNLYNEHFAAISDFEAKFDRNKHTNFGYLAFKQFPKKINHKKINKKRESIGLLSADQFQAINSTKLITKFWNRLY